MASLCRFPQATSVIRSTSRAAVVRPASPKSHDAAGGTTMMPPGLQHVQQLIQQQLSPAQVQTFLQQQGLLMQQQVGGGCGLALFASTRRNRAHWLKERTVQRTSSEIGHVGARRCVDIVCCF